MASTDTFEPIPLDELQWWWSDDGIPIFIGTVDDICLHAEAAGFQIYYVLTTGKTTEKKGNMVTTHKTPTMFKIVNNIVGRAVVVANDEIPLDEIEPAAYFNLPPIPYAMVKLLDSFFRTIDEMYGTEAIVLLTFDSTKESDDPSGWGILVPDQENTSGFCDYEPESIVDEKPDEVYIVGSVHSHPGMSAFASGTDHKDQAQFDGLHITYGWQKSKNGGATEYHIELQMSGNAFTLQPGQVFGDIPTEEPDEVVKEWAKKVKKKSYSQGNSHGPKTGMATSQGSGTSQGTSSPYSTPSKGAVDRWKIEKNLPTGAPDYTKNIIIGTLKEGETACPFCDTRLISQDYTKRRCLACHNYFCVFGETLQDIVNMRQQAKLYSYELDVDAKPGKPIYLWNRTASTSELVCLYAPENVLSSDGSGKS
jgi:hypothetical protein